MNKNAAAILALFLLLCPPVAYANINTAAPAASAQDNADNVFMDKNLGYSFTLPAGWQAEADEKLQKFDDSNVARAMQSSFMHKVGRPRLAFMAKTPQNTGAIVVLTAPLTMDMQKDATPAIMLGIYEHLLKPFRQGDENGKVSLLRTDNGALISLKRHNGTVHFQKIIFTKSHVINIHASNNAPNTPELTAEIEKMLYSFRIAPEKMLTAPLPAKEQLDNEDSRGTWGEFTGLVIILPAFIAIGLFRIKKARRRADEMRKSPPPDPKELIQGKIYQDDVIKKR